MSIEMDEYIENSISTFENIFGDNKELEKVLKFLKIEKDGEVVVFDNELCDIEDEIFELKPNIRKSFENIDGMNLKSCDLIFDDVKFQAIILEMNGDVSLICKESNAEELYSGLTTSIEDNENDHEYDLGSDDDLSF